jgi:hypothetical protein
MDEKKFKFLDGYAAGLKRAVNLKIGKLIGLKSHDFHIEREIGSNLFLNDFGG